MSALEARATTLSSVLQVLVFDVAGKYCSSHISWELRYAMKADCCHVCYLLLKYCVCLSLVHKHITNTSRTKSFGSIII